MDGRGRWMDNVFIERLWRSVKYEDIYLKEYAGIPDLRTGLREWFERYNMWRPHAALGNQTPAVVHLEARKEKEAEVISSPMPPECGKVGRFFAACTAGLNGLSASLQGRWDLPFRQQKTGALAYRFALTQGSAHMVTPPKLP